ncbi:MAG: sigma-54 dependent transcriptional regulator [Gemmatimonadetes bacterium]|nr:sigma-54 dependent transcriptional regulator [Gemmatimonadota bacterium]
MSDTLLLVEDEAVLRDELGRHFTRQGWDLLQASTLAEARPLLAEGGASPLVVLCDMTLPDGNALDLLEAVRAGAGSHAEWIVLTGYGTVADSVRALKLGAFEFLEKPCPLERLDLVVAGAARSARAQRRVAESSARNHERFGLDAFVGDSPAAVRVRDELRRLSAVPVGAMVIGGETGTGKGLVARILHYTGARGNGPLVEVNCAALPEELMESELFGHEAGAFTGARTRHRGYLEQAHGGTLFLDEIGELDAPLQAKLLKALEDRRFRRVGGEKEVVVDVQVFAASNRDVDALVSQGRLREDLFHRLSLFRVEVPPLRERLEDLEPLVMRFIAEFNARSSKTVRVVPDSVWRRLRGYTWPGNVRELRNVIERSVLLADGPVLPERWLQVPEGVPEGASAPAPQGAALPQDTGDSGAVLAVRLDGSESLDGMEARILRHALELVDWNVSAAARLLGVSRQTLRYRIDKHGLGEEAKADEE